MCHGKLELHPIKPTPNSKFKATSNLRPKPITLDPRPITLDPRPLGVSQTCLTFPSTANLLDPLKCTCSHFGFCIFVMFSRPKAKYFLREKLHLHRDVIEVIFVT